MMPEATVTREESAYRAKYYKGITSVKRRDLFCSSCGNTISFEADNYYSHPFLGILQCRACYDQFRVLKSKQKIKTWKKRCLMCGSDHCQTLFPCPVEDCPYSFCKNCIKRNAASALLLADTTNWKCFVCLTNPLWEARGVCASLMSASPRRRKKQKTVRDESSDDDDIDDIKAKMLSQKRTRVSRKVDKSWSIRERKPRRNASRSSGVKIEEDTDDDIEVISVSKPQRSSRQRSTKSSRKDSSERSTTPESSDHRSKLSEGHPTRKTRAGSVESRKGTHRIIHRLENVKRQNSDSSSGKEFTQKKIIKESYVTLQRLSLVDQDFTHAPDEPDSPGGTILSQKQIFSLKNSLQDFINNLKSTSKKMMDVANSLHRQYSQKDMLRPIEATTWIAECKTTTSSLRKELDDNEHKLVNKFGSWCKKSKIRNIFISTNGIDASVTPSRSGLDNTRRERGIVPSSSDEEEREKKDREESSSVDRTPEVSDCESAEIFTQDEEAHSSKTKSKSRSLSKRDKSLSPVHEEPNGLSSDVEHSEASCARSSRVTENCVDVDDIQTGRERAKDGNSSNDDMFADFEEDGRKGGDGKQEKKKQGTDSGNTSEEKYSPGPKSSKKSRNKIIKKVRGAREDSPDHSLLSGDEEEDGKGSEKKKRKSSLRDSDGEQKLKRKLSSESAKSIEGRKRNKSEKGKKSKEKLPSLIYTDSSSDEEKNSKPKSVRNKSKSLSHESSGDECISKTKDKKRKVKAGSTSLASDIDTSDDDKIVEPADKSEDIGAAVSSSDEDDTTNSTGKHRKEVEPQAGDDNIQSGVNSSDIETVKPKKSKDSKSKDDSSPEESEPEKKTEERKSQEDQSPDSSEKKASSSGVADNDKGKNSDGSFISESDSSPSSNTSSKNKGPAVEPPEVDGNPMDSSSPLGSPNSGTVDQLGKSDEPKLTEAQVSEREEETSNKSVEQSEKHSKQSTQEDSDGIDAEEQAEAGKTPSDSEHEKEVTKENSGKKLNKHSKESSKEPSDASDVEEPTEDSPSKSSDRLDDATEAANKSKEKELQELPNVEAIAKDLLLHTDSSSDVDEAVALEESEKSDDKRLSDHEKVAKDILLNSDSSSDDDEKTSPDKSESETPHIEETTKDSLLEPDNASDKVSDDTVSKGGEERAKQALLDSNSSLEDLETSKTKESEMMDSEKTRDGTSSAEESDKSKGKDKSDTSAVETGISNPSPKSKKTGSQKLRDLDNDAKKVLLRSSSSSSSADDNEHKKKKLPLKKPTTSDPDSDSMLSSPRVKRRKLCIKNSEFYKNDKKLRMRCLVVVKSLSNSILRRHAKALKKSKEYLEDKELKSLTTLDGLEKSRKRDRGNASDSSDTTSTSKVKKPTSKQAHDSLMDHLNLNGEKIDADDSSSSAENTEIHVKSQYSGDLHRNAEALAKAALLDSSDEEKPVEISSDDDSVRKGTKESGKSREKDSEKNEGSSSASNKAEWKRSKLLTMKLSSSDEEDQSMKFEKKVQRISQKDSDDSDDSDYEDESKKKKRVRRRRLNSDSDIKLTDEEPSEDSENPEDSKKTEKKGKKRLKKVDNSSDSSSSFKNRPKPKRRRVRTAGTDSDSDIDDISNSQGSPNKSGRKNIRKVIKDTKVADDTKQAAKQEEERLKRMAERQKLYNEMYEARLAGEEKVDKLILDFDEESKEELLSVHEGLVKKLKPHQAQGIKFMWDACFESLERSKTTSGSGCILAHCMGLGKSFQAVTLTHTLLVNTDKTGVRTVLVVCPLSTVLNWVNEFKIWLNEVNDGDDVEVYELTKFKQNAERRFQLERWQRTGGVMILGYEMYRNLSNPTKKINKKLRESFFNTLVEPGPDLVICDEGHLLKSETTAISKAMSKIKTLRRIVLTGTPLQNNLTEYHCMVQFVKPNLLGTKKEFLNRFVNPIQNGQFDNSTEYDVKLMKKRAHVLHKMLEGSVQRFDYSVLTPFLPPKQEYVIFVKLSDIQIQLYQYYIDNLARRHRGAGGSLFADFQALQRIWTHPIAIKLNAAKVAEKKLREASDSEGSLRDFIDDGSDDESSKSDSSNASTSSSKSKKSDVNNVPVKRHTRANADVEEVTVEESVQEQEWWSQFLQDEHFEDLRISAKLRILFEILKECENIGDKVLVFSQSLYSLTLIERFLATIDDATQTDTASSSELIDGHTGSWSLGLDYFRLDGQTTTENRSLWCKIFNRPTNTRARLFLISTRAGGLGINLTAANRVVIFDASWNPSHDVQSIFRIYRFGQKKPCYVYRLLASGTMEEKIYNRQVTKLSLSCRVVDEQQIERHYTNSDLAELYTLDRPPETPVTIGCPKDRLLAEIFSKHKDLIVNFHEHDSLLENKADEGLDEEERKQAWLEYEQEKAGRPPVNPMINAGFNYQDQLLQFNQQVLNPFSNGNAMQIELNNLQRLYQKDFPNMTPEQQTMLARKALMDMYSYMENQTVMSNRVPQLGASTAGYSNPTNTLANQLAQEAYTRHHQQAKQMTAYQKQLLYAQQFGNFKSVAGSAQRAPQNSTMYSRQATAMQPRATASSDPDILEIIPSPATSNSTVQSSSTQSKPAKYQEE